MVVLRATSNHLHISNVDNESEMAMDCYSRSLTRHISWQNERLVKIVDAECEKKWLYRDSDRENNSPIFTNFSSRQIHVLEFQIHLQPHLLMQ